MVHSPVEITSVDDARIAFFRGLKGNHPRLADTVLVEGELQFERLLSSGLRIRTVFFERELVVKYADALGALEHAEVYVADRQLMAQIVGYRLHRGCMVLAEPPALVAPNALGALVVALDGIIDPENVGSIVRSAVAFGVSSFLLDETSADPLLRRAVRVSMGASLFVQRARTSQLSSALTALKQTHRIIGVDNVPGSVPLTRMEFQGANPLIFVFGNERHGLSAPTLQACDSVVSIPMDNSVLASLNVNSASAIIFYELFAARGGENALDQAQR